MKSLAHLLTMLGLLVCVACHSAPADSPTTRALGQLLEGAPRTTAPVWTDVTAFYAQRDRTPAWVSSKGKVEASDVFAVLDSVSDHGLPDDYGRQDIAASIATLAKREGSDEQRAAAAADLDLRITAALLSLARDVALGRTSPASIDRRWKARRAVPDFVGTLAASQADLRQWLDRVKPVHPEYARLQKGLKSLRGQTAGAGWPKISAKALAPGGSAAAVPALRRRLGASGELGAAAAVSESRVYDPELTAAVKAFQEHHTLKASGIADASTIAAMNVPIEARIAQVAANLERWRWMPDDFGERHFIVNIPSYHVVAREHGRDVLDIRVVVGKADGHETPVFSSDMTTIVFSPYWNIPDTIAEGETVPALVRDPRYLERNHIEVLRTTKSGVAPVDAKDVDWSDEGATRGLLFRQKPGADNALGHVKFLFPNPFDVYLHDTPADALFSRTGRAFSHGCVRVEEPEALAKYVLRGNEAWGEEQILKAMNAGEERAVKLSAPIPVHIVYFTASVDEHGGLHLWNDIYGYDSRQAR